MDKIEISRSSAAWRYYQYLNYEQASLEGRKYWDEKNLNLCAFVRRMFFWTIFFGFCFTFLFALILLAISSAVFTVYWPFAHGWVWPAKGEELFAALLTTGCVVWSVLGFVCLLAGIFYVREVVGSRAAPENQGLFHAWLRAKKEKVCPLVELKE